METPDYYTVAENLEFGDSPTSAISQALWDAYIAGMRYAAEVCGNTEYASELILEEAEHTEKAVKERIHG